MRVSIFRQGETMFSFLIIYLQKTFVFLILAIILLMLLWMLSTLIGNGIFLHYSM